MKNKKIKKRAGWSHYSAPNPPRKPKAPVKFLTEDRWKEIHSKVVYPDSPVSFAELHIPDGIDLQDTYLTLRTDAYDDGSYTLVTSTVTRATRENPHFESEKARYEKELTDWQAQMKLHQQELQEWKAWKKQETSAAVERKLAAAENFLKRHGRLL